MKNEMKEIKDTTKSICEKKVDTLTAKKKRL